MQYVHVSSVVVVHGDPTRRMYMCMSSSNVEASVAMRNRCTSLWSFELHVLQPILFLIRVAQGLARICKSCVFDVVVVMLNCETTLRLCSWELSLRPAG